MENWDSWISAALSTLSTRNLLRSTRPINLSSSGDTSVEFETFDSPRQWDRSSVEVELEEEVFRQWLHDLPLPSGGKYRGDDESLGRKMLLFSGNDYLGLSTHPAVRMAAARAARKNGMGPRGSSLICGYTDYHRVLEASLAKLKKKEDCLLCPTGFAANMAFISALGSVSSLLVTGRKPFEEERIAIFSDVLNHASIIDGICLTKQLREVEVFIYRHCDLDHLNSLLSCCKINKKVVITDSLFSMDGDFAPVLELVHLRRKHGFLLVIDDAHATLVCGENGGGVPEIYHCENDIDICLGTLSKAAAALFVAKQEKWRRRAIWRLVHDFRSLSGLPVTSPIISIIVGSEESALLASRHMLLSGFHITAIRPPTVPPNSCRLRITLSAAHTFDDIRKLVAALSQCIKLPIDGEEIGQLTSKL